MILSSIARRAFIKLAVSQKLCWDSSKGYWGHIKTQIIIHVHLSGVVGLDTAEVDISRGSGLEG